MRDSPQRDGLPYAADPGMTGDAARDTVPSRAQVQWQYCEGESSMGWAALRGWANAVRDNPEQEECPYAVGPR